MTTRFVCATSIALVVCVAVWQQASSAAARSAPDPAALPLRLADTGLYATDTTAVVAPGNRPFVPQYPLWSDGMTKRRWVYLPPGRAIDATSDTAWDFPIGTRFWKEFSLNGRKIETRMVWKASAAGWVFASYVWNAEGTDAVLAPDEGIPGAIEVAPGRRHSIPSRTDCTACHGTKRSAPLGFNALQLSTDRDPNAIHGEPLGPGMLTLRNLVDEGLLSPARSHLVTNPPRIRTSNPSTRAALGYLAVNCGTCHNGSGDVSVLGPSLNVGDLLADGDSVAKSLFARRSTWQVPGVAEGESRLAHPGSPETSAMLVRMRSRAPSSQMPPLGTVLRDQRAVDAISRWIALGLERVP